MTAPPKMTHIQWRVYCRTAKTCTHEWGGMEHPNPWIRLGRKAARGLAEEHHQRAGHAAEVVKVRFETMDWVGGDV